MCNEETIVKFEETNHLPFTIKHYTLTFPIGRGAFSRVYQATDNKYKRNVAVKVI